MTFGQGLQGLAHEWGLNNYYHAKVEGQYGVGNARLLGRRNGLEQAHGNQMRYGGPFKPAVWLE